jgi:hypothetical protein
MNESEERVKANKIKYYCGFIFLCAVGLLYQGGEATKTSRFTIKQGI